MNRERDVRVRAKQLGNEADFFHLLHPLVNNAKAFRSDACLPPFQRELRPDSPVPTPHSTAAHATARRQQRPGTLTDFRRIRGEDGWGDHGTSPARKLAAKITSSSRNRSGWRS